MLCCHISWTSWAELITETPQSDGPSRHGFDQIKTHNSPIGFILFSPSDVWRLRWDSLWWGLQQQEKTLSPAPPLPLLTKQPCNPITIHSLQLKGSALWSIKRECAESIQKDSLESHQSLFCEVRACVMYVCTIERTPDWSFSCPKMRHKARVWVLK